MGNNAEQKVNYVIDEGRQGKNKDGWRDLKEFKDAIILFNKRWVEKLSTSSYIMNKYRRIERMKGFLERQSLSGDLIPKDVKEAENKELMSSIKNLEKIIKEKHEKIVELFGEQNPEGSNKGNPASTAATTAADGAPAITENQANEK